MLKILIKLLGAGILFGSLSLAWFIMDFQSFKVTPLVPDGKPFKYRITPGTSLTRLAHDLDTLGLIDRPRYFIWLAKWQYDNGTIKTGEYQFSPGTGSADFLEKIIAGKVIQHPLTIIEGWNFRQLLNAIEKHDKIEHQLTGLTNEEIMRRLGLDAPSPEGLFFPDTYYVTRHMSDVQLLQRANQLLNEFLQTSWQQREVGLPYKTPYEALIMASIIEKETAAPEERQQIAGVFVRRLQKRMRLQTDPTVIYGLGETFNGNITRRDLKTDTPYNTYTRRGLPPTPIAMAGRESIYAALHPASGDALYFVAKGDGTHYFSATMEEHNRAVKKYQLRKN